MLPLGTRPVIDRIIEELSEAGVTDVLVLSSRRKKSLEDWFDRDPELEAAFADRPARRAQLDPPKIRVQFVRQQAMRGTGHALLLAREFAGNDPVIVAYPDDLFGQPNVSRALMEAYARTGRSILSARDLTGQDVSRYGVLDVADAGASDLVVQDIVEKPDVGSEPSHLVSLGRYLFAPDLFPLLEEGLEAHAGGEYYHIHALRQLASRGALGALVVEAPHQDTGEPLGYLKAVISEGLADREQGDALRAWLREQL
jgi:UTP--glucose-1-phosphate uridylyltransferase